MRTIYTNSIKFLTALTIAATALLASCGGSGLTTTQDNSSAARIQLLISSPQMPSSGETTVEATAIVLTSTGQTVTGQAVTFSTNSDPTAYFSSVSGVSDDNGLVTATLNLGSSHSNRTISLTATAGAATGGNSVNVTGNTITVSGGNSLALGGSGDLTFTVSDSAGAALPFIPITLTSQAGNTITPSAGYTNATDDLGQFKASVTASTSATTDVITANSAGVVETFDMSISDSSFAFITPLADAQIPINTVTPLSLTWSNSAGPVNGSSVTFSSSRGTLASANATTNPSGVAATSITSASTGSTIISAAGPGGTPSTLMNVTFYTDTASSVAMQANPGTVAVTTGVAGQTSNSSVISLVVRDSANNLVQNAQVNLAVTQDSSGGHLSAASATTDVYGAASVNYIAGGSSTGQNQVVITATVNSININGVDVPLGTPVSGTVTLTVSGQSLFVTLGTDNLLISEPPKNRKQYVAIVTDAAGNAAPGVTVSFKLRPYAYYKGEYVAGASTWLQAVSTGCDQEDDGAGVDAALAFNSILDTNINGDPSLFEDFNGNGLLDPGNGTATITPESQTDADGFAYADVVYAKDHATWAEFIIEARVGVDNNVPASTARFLLAGVASDYSNLTFAPPGQLSPYGTANSCALPN